MLITFVSLQTGLVFNFFSTQITCNLGLLGRGLGMIRSSALLGVKLERDEVSSIQGVSRRCSEASKTRL
jgi:hypothetical protein